MRVFCYEELGNRPKVRYILQVLIDSSESRPDPLVPEKDIDDLHELVGLLLGWLPVVSKHAIEEFQQLLPFVFFIDVNNFPSKSLQKVK